MASDADEENVLLDRFPDESEESSGERDRSSAALDQTLSRIRREWTSATIPLEKCHGSASTAWAEMINKYEVVEVVEVVEQSKPAGSQDIDKCVQPDSASRKMSESDDEMKVENTAELEASEPVPATPKGTADVSAPADDSRPDRERSDSLNGPPKRTRYLRKG